MIPILASFKVAFKALSANKMRSFLTMLGIIIGVSSVITLVSIGEGLKKTVVDQMNSFGTDQIYVMPGDIMSGAGMASSAFGAVSFDFSDADMLESQLSGVKGVVAINESFSTAELGGEELKAVDIISTTSNYSMIAQDDVINGTFFSQSHQNSKSNVIVVGQTFREKLFNGKDPLGKQVTVDGKKFTIIGELEKKGATMGVDQDTRAYVPVGSLTSDQAKHPTTIIVKAENNDDIPRIADSVKRVMRQKYDSDEFSVLTQEETQELVSTILGAVSSALVGIAAISLLVGGIGISNIMLVSITERTSEIGLRKALGAKPKDILQQFLVEAIVLTVVGGLIGVGLGYFAGYGIGLALPSLKPSISITTILMAAGFSALVGVAFGVFPAVRASKLDPIEALRYE